MSDFEISGQSPIKENCYTSRISNDIDMILGPITKLGRRNTATSKKLTMVSYQQTVISLSFFRFMANLKQSGSWIANIWSVKLTFN